MVLYIRALQSTFPADCCDASVVSLSTDVREAAEDAESVDFISVSIFSSSVVFFVPVAGDFSLSPGLGLGSLRDGVPSLGCGVESFFGVSSFLSFFSFFSGGLKSVEILKAYINSNNS